MLSFAGGFLLDRPRDWAASLDAHFVLNAAAWPLGGFLATTVYLLASASQLAVAQATRPRRA
jgi:hypothetical protein